MSPESYSRRPRRSVLSCCHGFGARDLWWTYISTKYTPIYYLHQRMFDSRLLKPSLTHLPSLYTTCQLQNGQNLYHFCRIYLYQPISPRHQRTWYLHGPGLCPKAADIPRLHYSYLDPCLILLLMVVIKYIWPQDDAPPRDQIKLEMKSNLRAFPLMTVLTLPLFQAEVTVIQICMQMLRSTAGRTSSPHLVSMSLLYSAVSNYSIIVGHSFLLLTDYGIYSRWKMTRDRMRKQIKTLGRLISRSN